MNHLKRILIAEGLIKAALDQGAINLQYLNGLSSREEAKILNAIADVYQIGSSEAKAEVMDRGAEPLYEYLSYRPAVARKVLLDMTGKRASTRKTAHRPHFVTPKELRDGHAFMTYKIDAGKNNSKFYEGKITPADDGSWSLLKRWGALTDKGPDRSRVDGAKYDKHGLTES